jgi:hypothetical protein
MPRIALEDHTYEVIKEHILNPETSQLLPEQKEMFDRVISVAKVLDKNPAQKNAIALHLAKYPEIGRTRAFYDIKLAMKLFNTIHSFEYDFWQTWAINDIVANINRARANLDKANDKNRAAMLRVIAMEHANLLKAIGEKPLIPVDPHLTEKHEFKVLIQVNNQNMQIDFEKLRDLPTATLKELTAALFSGQQITEDQAAEIMET